MSRKKKVVWGTIDYVPATYKTRREAEFYAVLTGKRTRFTERGGGFVQMGGAMSAALKKVQK